MKTSLILLCLALFVAAVFAADCDRDGNGMPTCTGTSDTKYRNFWDPTRYWMCVGNNAVPVLCGTGGFMASANDCVDWSVWNWVPPCPEN